MKRFFSILFVFFLVLPLGVQAAEYLVPVGALVGLHLQDDTITVAAFDDLLGKTAQDAGLRVGDKIEAVNGTPIVEAEQIRPLVENSTGAVVSAPLRTA